MGLLIAATFLLAGFTGIGYLIHLSFQQQEEADKNEFQWEMEKFIHYIKHFDADTPGEELLRKYSTLRELKKENDRLHRIIITYKL